MGQMYAEWLLGLCGGSMQMLNEMVPFESTLGS